GRGHDDGRPHRDHVGRAPAAGRHAAGGLRPAGQPVRGPVHRHTAHEHAHRHRDDRRRNRARRRRRPRAGAAAAGADHSARGGPPGRRRRPPRAPRAQRRGAPRAEGAGRRVAGARVPRLRGDRRLAPRRAPDRPGPAGARRHGPARGRPGARPRVRPRDHRAPAVTAEAVTSPAARTPTEAPRRRRRRRYSPREVALALALLAPSTAVFVVFFYRPFLNLLNWGRFESRRNGAYFEDVGLAQYREALGSDDFREGLWHSVQFVLYTVPAGLVLGVLLAVAAHRRLRGIKVFQAIFSSTLASSTAVTSVIFFYLFNPVVGLIEANWLNDPDMAMVAVSISSIWQNMGLSFVIVLAGLQAVPDEVMEAALLDGYGAVRRLVRITLPLISPVLLFLLVVLVIF